MKKENVSVLMVTILFHNTEGGDAIFPVMFSDNV